MGPTVFPLPCSIDCAGILKLRNSDIELRKGETDIGRKNTRVRVVFRVHIPQPNGKVLSLQAASIPVECCECQLPSLSLTHAHTPKYINSENQVQEKHSQTSRHTNLSAHLFIRACIRFRMLIYRVLPLEVTLDKNI